MLGIREERRTEERNNAKEGESIVGMRGFHYFWDVCGYRRKLRRV